MKKTGKFSRILVTSALTYANGYTHLGHIAGSLLPADMYVRYLRLAGYDVLYVCGSDEHGTAIDMAAIKEKLTPELEKSILGADNKATLEDLYLPYKPKRKTKALIARENGQEPLALLILEQKNIDAQAHDEMEFNIDDENDNANENNKDDDNNDNYETKKSTSKNKNELFFS